MTADPITFILIDCENVQPKDIKLLTGGPFCVKLFLGRNQTKIPVEWAAALQPLGTNAGYVCLKGIGSNALDFHVAFYLGELSCQQPEATFHIISKDKGFDPLAQHLNEKGLRVYRNACIADMSCFKRVFPPTIADQIDAVVANLERNKSARPRTLKTLRSTINAWFNKEVSDARLTDLVDQLRSQGIIKDAGAKISYHFPARAA